MLRRIWFRKRHFSELEAVFSHFKSSTPPKVMVDVGSRYGESAEPFLGMGWDVVAFEPDPANRSCLQKRIGRFKKLRVLPLACSDKEQSAVPFYSSSESDGISSLSAFRPTHVETARVDVTTLRRVLAELPFSAVDFLKIDAEGHDLFVLRGFPWEKYTPQIVLCEFEDSKTRPLGYEHSELGDFLLSVGYAVFVSEWRPIVRYGVSHSWKRLNRYPCEGINPRGWGNFIAVRSDIDPEFLTIYSKSFSSCPRKRQ